ncbi:MAG: hypothetical protein K2H44_02125 [Muribaculaceae bacterium]|nr:hypothetical protein [Muribaculaceae bacterium]
MASSGRDIKIEIPATKIIEINKSQSVNMIVVTLTFSIPVEKTENDKFFINYTFTLTPVTLETTTETINTIVPYTETPTMANLLLNKSKIVLTFSKQNSDF